MPLILFDLVHLPMSLIDFLIVWRHVSSLWIMTILYNYWWLVTSFGSILVKKETPIFYLANVITFSLFLGLLRWYNLLVRYKLNRFRPLRVNQFDICALLFGGYTRFILLGKIVYRYNGKPYPLWNFIDVTVSFDIFSIL